MLILPPEIMLLLQHFVPVFSPRIFDWVQVLLVGAILAPRQRTVAAVLRIVGLGNEAQFQNYHRTLNRASWSGLEANATRRVSTSCARCCAWCAVGNPSGNSRWSRMAA